ncbi:hypothetical protein Gohar_004443 [Gossypium harknessii]|uniref:Uncharacterized protein n=1 Tax=Gossypium harknessii TaxID=34285 RepID=A0A7J9H7I4_9ROSI|nr:hypothetical protein [Gossypium harknessii]
MENELAELSLHEAEKEILQVFPHSECNPFSSYEMHDGESLASDKRDSDLKSRG